MFRHVLLPTDGSDFANAAVKRGAEFAKSINAKITVVHVTPPWDIAAPSEVAIAFPTEDMKANIDKTAQDSLNAAEKVVADATGETCNVVHMSQQYPAEGVIDAAEKNDCDIIVLASHGRRGLSKLLLGSTAQELLTRASVPVLIMRD